MKDKYWLGWAVYAGGYDEAFFKTRDDRRKKIQELIQEFGDRLYLRYQDYD